MSGPTVVAIELVDRLLVVQAVAAARPSIAGEAARFTTTVMFVSPSPTECAAKAPKVVGRARFTEVTLNR
jgi:hypothetical protein